MYLHDTLLAYIETASLSYAYFFLSENTIIYIIKFSNSRSFSPFKTFIFFPDLEKIYIYNRAKIPM